MLRISFLDTNAIVEGSKSQLTLLWFYPILVESTAIVKSMTAALMVDVRSFVILEVALHAQSLYQYHVIAAKSSRECHVN